MTDWPKQITPLNVDTPGDYVAELRRHLEDPDAVIVLNGDGSLHGVRRLTTAEMWAAPDGIMDTTAPHAPGGQP